MRRSLLVTTLLAPFGLALLPLAALIMTAGGSEPASTTVQLRPATEVAEPIAGRLPDTAAFAQDSVSECSESVLGS